MSKRFVVSVLFLLSVLCVCVAVAEGASSAKPNVEQLFAEGVAAYDAGNYAKALASFTKVADQGYAEAQYNLGTMYMDGRGVTQDDKQAVAWYRKAADQGYAMAQYNLGVMYENGRGVAKDERRAIEYWKMAARQGDEDARYNLAELGVLYY